MEIHIISGDFVVNFNSKFAIFFECYWQFIRLTFMNKT